MAPEIVPVSMLRYRLGQLRAQYRPDKTADPSKSHVYYMPSTRRWLLVKRRDANHVTISYHDTCPCALSQA
jgi:hypothetical protein